MAYMNQEKKALIAAELKKVIPASWKWSLAVRHHGELLEIFQKIHEALNTGNWDKSDIMTDYFNVGHYVDLHIGRWDKPFQVLAASETPEQELARLKAKLAEMEAA